MVEADMEKIVGYIDQVLNHHEDESLITEVKSGINAWTGNFPLYK